MHKILLLVAIFCPLLSPAHGRGSCSAAHNFGSGNQAKTTVLSPLEDQYDLTFVRLQLELSNMGPAVAGSATSSGRVTAASMAQYCFELNSALVIDSMRFNGALLLPATQSNGLRTVTLPAALPGGSTFTATVWYHGSTPPGSGFFTHGLSYYNLGHTNIVFSLSDPDLAKDWWPCKQSLTDKIDSAELWFTVPDSCKAGSNGKLAAVTSLGGGRSRYEWKTRYPIEYYLISVAVAPYAERSSHMHFTDGSGDSMLLQHFIYDTASFNPVFVAAIDSTGVIVDHFSRLFGRYPFWQEKYGHCMAPLGGGMEHQTMTTLGAAQTTLIAHELGHQWWGNHVTYGSWQDIWLSEGLASYCEQLFIEQFRGAAAARAYRTGVFNAAMAGLGGSVYVDDTTDVYRIFDNRLTYNKGAAVAHMLRFVAPQDSLYFSLLRSYQQQFAHGTAVTADLQSLASATYGIDLDTFFQQWVYGQGQPNFTGSWNQLGSTVLIRLGQTGSVPASVATFHTPVQLRLFAPGSDTTVLVYSSAEEQYFRFNWDKQMTSFSIDPDDHILNRVFGNLPKDPTLSVDRLALASLLVTPNPATDSWQVAGLPPRTDLRLVNTEGKNLWMERGVKGTCVVPASQLPAGHYILHIQTPGIPGRQFRMQKR